MPRWSGSTTPLIANDTYVGTVLQPETADNFVGLVFADAPGNLNIDQSVDGGANWDLTTTIAVSASTGTSFSVQIFGNAVRIRYVNGAGAQAVFRIKGRFSSAGPR